MILYHLFMEKLQVRCIKLHVANLLKYHLLDLVAILLLFVPRRLLGHVGTLKTLLHVTNRLEGLLLALVTDLPGLLLAVLGVAVLLGLLRASLHLKLADLLGLEVAVLFLHWEGEDIGKLLAIPVDISLAHLHLDLSWDVITVLFALLVADHTLWPITIILGALVPLAVEHHGVGAGHIVDDLFLHVAIWSFKVSALVIILGGHVDLVSGVTDPVLAREAPLDLVGFLQGLVVNGLDKVAHQLVDIEADSLHISLDYPSAVLVQLGLAFLVILRPASLLGVGLALVLKDHLLHHVAVGVLVDAVPSYIVLANVRTVLLGRSRCWILRRRWEAEHEGEEGDEDCSLDHLASTVGEADIILLHSNISLVEVNQAICA